MSIPNLSHLQRSHPQDVRKLLGPDKLFEARTLVDLEVLAGTLERAIRDGTTEEIVYDGSPENVSDGRMDASDAGRPDLRSRPRAECRR